MNEGSICSGAGGLYGPSPPAVNGATRAIYRPPGLKLFMTTDCVVAFKDICPSNLFVVFDFICICSLHSDDDGGGDSHRMNECDNDDEH